LRAEIAVPGAAKSGVFQSLVMPGLGPGIHVCAISLEKGVDGRETLSPSDPSKRRIALPGHDGKGNIRLTAALSVRL
jgi:hypothetical protein